MNTFSLYSTSTGIFTGRQVTTSAPTPEWLEAETPVGYALLSGAHDHETTRVDLKNGVVVDYVPDRPSADHELVDGRWRLSREVVERASARSRAQGEIDALDLKKVRAMSEVLLENDLLRRESSLERLKDFDDQIKDLRKQL